MREGKTKFIITAGCVICLNVASICLLYLLFDNINLKRKDVSGIRSQIWQYEKRIANIKVLKKTLAELGAERSEINAAFLTENSIVNFIEELEYLSKKTGAQLKIKVVDLPSGAPERPRFHFSLEGSFLDIYHYLLLLENDRYQIGWDRVYIQRLEQVENWGANLQLELLSFDY